MTLYEDVDDRLARRDRASFSQNALNGVGLNFERSSRRPVSSSGWFGFKSKLAFGFAFTDLVAILFGFLGGALIADALRAALGTGNIEATVFLTLRLGARTVLRSARRSSRPQSTARARSLVCHTITVSESCLPPTRAPWRWRCGTSSDSGPSKC